MVAGSVTVPLLADLAPLGREGAIDWDLVRNEFIQGDVTPAEIARRYEVNPDHVSKRIQRERWGEARARYQDRLREQVYRENVGKVAREWQQRFSELEEMVRHIRLWIDAKKAEQHVRCDGCGHMQPLGDLARLEPDAIKSLTQSLEIVVKNQRLLMGDSTENVQVDHHVEQMLVLIERWVPSENLERFKEDVAALKLDVVPR